MQARTYSTTLRTFLAWSAAFFGYAAFWFLTRLPAIRANTLFFDDFAMGPVSAADFYVGSYRPLLLLEYDVLEWIHRGHFFTVIPKIAATLYLAGAATALAILLRRWGASTMIAVSVPFLALANPVLNDAGLWQAIHGVTLSLMLITLGAVVWELPGIRYEVAGSTLILVGVFGYQILISLALFYLLAEPVVKTLTGRHWSLRSSVRRFALLCGIALIQIGSMQLIRTYRSQADERGFLHAGPLPALLATKIHGMIDLAVNGIMPVLAWYAGAPRAMSLWKWVPLMLAAATMVAVGMHRRKLSRTNAVLVLGAGALPFAALLVPAMPGVIMSISPYAWRVSSPVAFALAVACVPLLLTIRKPVAQMTVVVILVATMIPVAFYETQMRAVAYEREAALMKGIASHWNEQAVSSQALTLIYDGTGARADERLIGAHDLTWGYERRTPGMWSSFTDPWQAAHRAAFEGFRFVQCPAGPAALCAEAQRACSRNCSDEVATYPRVVHEPALKASVVCAAVISAPAHHPCK